MLTLTGSIADAAYAAGNIDRKADKLLAKMTLEEKVAQMMMVAMPASNAASVQKKYRFGGYILFGRDFSRNSKSSMKKLLRSCQRNSKRSMLLTVDEE